MVVNVTNVNSSHFSFDTLPVYKIANYPNVDNAYRPFTLLRFAIDENNTLLLRAMCFEENPVENDKILNSESFVFCFSFPFEQFALLISPKGKFELLSGKNFETAEVHKQEFIHTNRFQGGDQQGFYWGLDISIPVKEVFETPILKSKDQFKGNFYKLFYNNNQLKAGSFFSPTAIDDISTLLFDSSNWGTFQIID